MAPHEDTSTDSQRPRTDPDRHFSQADLHGLGEDPEQHALHSHIESKYIWGLSQQYESLLFYFWFLTSLCLEIAAAAIAPYYKTWRAPFIGTMTAFMVCHWAGWIQTVQGMLQRASWIREESDLETRRQFLRLAVRLNRLQLPTAVIALPVFIQAYARRDRIDDLPYWLLYLLIFIWCTVFSVMNAYNNITWESDRLAFEEGPQPYRITRLAILGLPSPKRKDDEKSGKQAAWKEA